MRHMARRVQVTGRRGILEHREIRGCEDHPATMTLRHPNSYFHEGNEHYKGNGGVKWCALCGTHRPPLGGSVQYVLGGRQYCCALHPKPKVPKCETPKIPKIAGKKPKPAIPTKNRESARVAMEAVKAVMTALTATLVVAPAKNGGNDGTH